MRSTAFGGGRSPRANGSPSGWSSTAWSDWIGGPFFSTLSSLTRYRYLIEQDIDDSDASHLIDALEDEDLGLRDEIGEASLADQIRGGRILFDAVREAKLEWFKGTIEVLSIHLSQYIYGLEVAETRDDGRRRIEILKYIGRRGEVITVPLTHTIEFPSGEVRPGLEDLTWVQSNWRTLPRWAQDGFRIKFPELRRL
jgi:hypothetical protein